MPQQVIVWAYDNVLNIWNGTVSGTQYYRVYFSSGVWNLVSTLPLSIGTDINDVDVDLLKATALNELTKFVTMIRNTMGALGLIPGLLGGLGL